MRAGLLTGGVVPVDLVEPLGSSLVLSRIRTIGVGRATLYRHLPETTAAPQ